MNSLDIVFFRTLIGSLFLVALFFLNKGKFHLKGNKRDFMFICLSGIAMGACWSFLYEAYHQIGVSFASLLYYCGPVIMMAVSPLIFKEKLTRPKIIGFLIVIIGILLVNGRMAVEGNAKGIFCGAMSAIMLFLVVTLNKQSRRIVGLENSVIQLAVSFVTVAVLVGVREGFRIYIPGKAWVWILILGIVNTGIGCWLYFSALGKLPVQTVAVCGYLEPLTAVVAAALLLGEKMTALQILGAIFIIGGAMIGELVSEKKQPSA